MSNPTPDQPTTGGVLTRRAVLAALPAAAVAGCRARDERGPGGEELLTLWHPWGGVQTTRFARVVAGFRKAHPNILLRAVYTQNDLSNNQKFFTAVAAGTPPDVIFVDGPQVAPWAEWGAITPLDEYLTAAGIRAEEYFPPTWKQCVYREKVWALTYTADPNFGFAYNRAAFRSAGLDPDRPPTTIEELDEVAGRMTRIEDGNLTRIGIIPWAQYGAANSMFTWGWAFGGEFYDEATGQVTADHPRVVRALEWMVTYARKYDPARIASLAAGIGAAEQDPFYTGRMGMRCLHIGGIGELERYAPDLDYGLTAIPAPPDGEQNSSWVGGWCMGIPARSRKPELAWKLIHWLCHTDEGTSLVGRESILFPGYRHSPIFEELRGRHHYDSFYRILEEARHQRPVIPVQAYYMRQLQRAVDAAVYGRLTPAQALARARRNTQSELDLARSG